MSKEKDTITNDTDIKCLAESYGITFKNKKTLCPFHADTKPSLHLYKDNSLYCFGCNKHLNPKQFIYEMEKLGKRPGVIVKKQFEGNKTTKKEKDNTLYWPVFNDIIGKTTPAVASEVAKEYLKQRGINLFLADQMKIRYISGSKELGFLFERHDKKILAEAKINSFYHNKEYQKQDFILLPYIRSNEVVAIKLRNLAAGAERVYTAFGSINDKIYNEQAAYKEGPELFITEGEIKTLSLLSAGYTAIGLPSKGAFKRRSIEKILSLDRKRKIILNFDKDAKKEGYLLKFELQKDGFDVASLCPDKDIDELLFETKDLTPYTLD